MIFVLMYLAISYLIMGFVVKSKGFITTLDVILFALSPITFPLVAIIAIVFWLTGLKPEEEIRKI